jgi:hypothetical protein
MEPSNQSKSGLPAKAEEPKQVPVQHPSTNTNPVPIANAEGQPAQPLGGAVGATPKFRPTGSSGATQAGAQRYKIVEKVQPDGTMKKYKRPIAEGDVSASAQQPKASTAGGVGAAASKTLDPRYKIVLIPQADGTLKKYKRPIVEGDHGKASQQPKATPASGSATAATKEIPTANSATNPAVTKSNEMQDSKPDENTTPTTSVKDVKTDAPPEKLADIDPASLERALEEQKQNMRERKMHGFRDKLLNGFAMAIGGSIPAFEITTDHRDGDEEISDDGDWSGEDEDIDYLDKDDVHNENEQGAKEPDSADNQSHGNIDLHTHHILS